MLPVRDAVHFPKLVTTLHVIRDPSLKAVRAAMEGDRTVLVLSQIDMSVEEPGVDDLAEVGLISEILQAIPMPDGGMRLVLRGERRVRALKLEVGTGGFIASAQPLLEIEPGDAPENEALMRVALESFERVVRLNKSIPPESLQTVAHAQSVGAMADAIAHHLPLRPSQKQELLEELSCIDRLRTVLRLVKQEDQVLELGERIHEQVERELGETQREFYLREQLKVIQTQLMTREDRLGETEEYAAKIEACGMPEACREKVLAEVRRLDRMPTSTPEGIVLRNYLDCVTSLPWSALTEDNLDVSAAAKRLDNGHYGLAGVKDRVLDTLAVRQLRNSARGPILCFAGPPGVGKTSIARSIAEAMGRKFVRISLGGVRDEAEIRGHRRTYIGAMPGRILGSLATCGSRNPVIVLDEIDKLGNDYRGDPTSALLEALDPEQNGHFTDHYVELPFDLSSAMFIATANLVEGIPPALLDRMEIIDFQSYTDEERREIAERFLIPKNIVDHGLSPSSTSFTPDAVRQLVSEYTREAGARNLEREIAGACRKAARLVAEGKVEAVTIDGTKLREFLGRPKYKRQAADLKDEVGVASGLVVSAAGGEAISIEVNLMEPIGGVQQLKLTGNLGEVMKESAEAALTFVRSMARELNESVPFRYDVHVHVPEGGIPKDGPSAGLTVAVSLASAFSGRPVRGDVAMTGEITLRGKVLAVGGIRDKVLAAYRAGFSTVILPQTNAPELDDVPDEVRQALHFELVSDLPSAFRAALR